jgi:hypothetical protein
MGSNASFFFFVNVPSVIEVRPSSEGGGVAVVCGTSRCITLEVYVGVKNVVAKCGDVFNTNPMEKKKR